MGKLIHIMKTEKGNTYIITTIPDKNMGYASIGVKMVTEKTVWYHNGNIMELRAYFLNGK